MRQNAPTLIDCFSGAGGLSFGLQQVGFKPVFAFDHDPDAVATYKANIGPHIEHAESHALSAAKILQASGLRKGECDLLAGGPPCQGFSQQGRGLTNDPRNELVLWFADLIAAIRPKFCLMENVPYLSSKRGKSILDRFLERLDSDYECSVSVLNAVQFDVPQYRQRLFVVGVRKDIGATFRFPKPKSGKRPDVRKAIGGLPSPPPVGEGEHPNFANHVRTAISSLNELRISHVPQGGGWRDIPERLQLACHKEHRGHGHIDVYGRLSWNQPAHTLTALCDSFTRGRYAHPKENRPITGREAAALQSFPNYFRFLADKKSVARLIGNAVPPKLSEAVGSVIFDLHKEYEQNKENSRYRAFSPEPELELIEPFELAAE